MKKVFLALSVMLLQAGVQTSMADDDHHPAPAVSKQFETLKQLLGVWEGTSDMGQGKQTMRVLYELTSGGTAIVETLMQGAPQEMVSVYHNIGDSVAMTHYCALGNQPHMRLKQANDKQMVFEMDEPRGIASIGESHMHALTLTLKDANTLQQDWVHYENGKTGQTTTFVLSRK